MDAHNTHLFLSFNNQCAAERNCSDLILANVSAVFCMQSVSMLVLFVSGKTGCWMNYQSSITFPGQSGLMVEVLLYIHRNRRFIRDRSPGCPPWPSHSSWPLIIFSVCKAIWSCTISASQFIEICILKCVYSWLLYVCLHNFASLSTFAIACCEINVLKIVWLRVRMY